MKILVTWASKMGGTQGIARMVGESLEAQGHEVLVRSVEDTPSVEGFDAVIIGGALYANRWYAPARRFVRRNLRQLRRVPTWFFSSGPLDASADAGDLPPPTEVRVLMERIGARGHMTFGGRLETSAKGFPASAMAKDHSGDWRNPKQIRQWALELARELPHASPGEAIDHPARAWHRLVAHGGVGWALCAAVMFALLNTTSVAVALIGHAILAPLIFMAVSWHYFGGRGAREPLPTALAFLGIVALLDLVIVAAVLERSFAMFASLGGTWVPFALLFFASWITGAVRATQPWPKAAKRATPRADTSTPGTHPSAGAA